MSFPDIMGLVGVVLILIAYFLLEIGKIDTQTLPYPVLNFVGALLIMFSLLYAFNFPALVMELAWAGISVMGIRRVLTKDKDKK